MKKFLAIALIAALGLATSAASCGSSPHDTAGKAIVAAEAAYHVVVEAELALRCGQPTAIVGHCISPEDHARYKGILLQIYSPGPPPTGYLQEARELYVLLPTSGTPSTAQIFALISKIGEIVQQVVAGLPVQSPKAIAAAGDENVVKTVNSIKVVK